MLGGGGGVFRPEATKRAVPGAGEGKAKTFNLLLAGPRVLNLCKLAETIRLGKEVAAKTPMKTTIVCIFLITNHKLFHS